MAKSSADKAVAYFNYAEHCLKVSRRLLDRESRIIHREMAAEWLMLADQAATQGIAPSAQADRTGKKANPMTFERRRLRISWRTARLVVPSGTIAMG